MKDSRKDKHVQWLIEGLNLEAEQYVSHLFFDNNINMAIIESKHSF